MVNRRQLFLQHVAQTSEAPLMVDIDKAEGVYLYDKDGKQYIDLISGISVSNIGHRNPKVVDAIKKQLDKHMYLMVYGELMHSPIIEYAELLTKHLPENLNSVYFVNSGSEAVDGAIKLAKRYTGRPEVLYFKKSYHGSSSGVLSVLGDEYFKRAFRPLIPGTRMLEYNNLDDLKYISDNTACIVVEPIQAESGVYPADVAFLKEIRKRCTETNTQMILDEIQTGFGRTGSLFAFEQYGFVPDILTIAKGMGGGMPIGAFVSSKEKMDLFTNKPILGHITTFGGHPVCCAAAKANLEELLENDWISKVNDKEALFISKLKHPAIKALRSKGLMISLEFETDEINMAVIQHCVANGVMVDWFLFAPNCLRIGPPLIITEAEIEEACEVILKAIEKAT